MIGFLTGAVFTGDVFGADAGTFGGSVCAVEVDPMLNKLLSSCLSAAYNYNYGFSSTPNFIMFQFNLIPQVQMNFHVLCLTNKPVRKRPHCVCPSHHQAQVLRPCLRRKDQSFLHLQAHRQAAFPR